MTDSTFPDDGFLATRRRLAVYRRLLRWYPASWRERNGEALIGALLDEADASGERGVSLRQRLRIAGHGAALRFALRRGSRETATAAILLGNLLWAGYLLLIAWAPRADHAGVTGPFSNPLVLAALPWFFGVATLAVGRGAIARGAFVVSAVAAGTVGALRLLVHPEWYGPGATVAVSLALVGALAALDRATWRFESAQRIALSTAALLGSLVAVLVVDIAFSTGSPAVGFAALGSMLAVLALLLVLRALAEHRRRQSRDRAAAE